MAKAEIFAGACGFTTVVDAVPVDGRNIGLKMESNCKAIQRLAGELTEVNAYKEFVFRGEGPQTLKLAAKYCSHAACPVPSGIIKAVEIAAGLNLPSDVSIKLSKD